MPSNKHPALFIKLLILLISNTLCFAQLAHAQNNDTKATPALSVTVSTAKQATWPNTLTTNGAIAPWQEAIIGAQVAGLRLSEISANVGDLVKKGQVLALFNNDLLKADESRLIATYQQAQTNSQRALKLKGTGAMSEQEVLQYITQAQVAKAQLQTTQLQLRYAKVTAPADGIITSRSATIGAVSTSGQELFRLIVQNRLEWRGQFIAQQLTQIKTGQAVSLALPDGSTATGKVRQISPSLDSQSRLGLVYADITPGSVAKAGMFVSGQVTLSTSPAIVVPAMSIVIRDGRSYVPVVDEHNVVHLQAVDTGRRQSNLIEIVSGIKDGEKVVDQGAGFLNDGDTVHVVSDTNKE